MTKADIQAENQTKPTKGRSLWADGIRRLRKRKFAVVCFFIVLVYFILAGLVYLDEQIDKVVHETGTSRTITYEIDIPWFRWNEIVGPPYQKPMTKYEWTPQGQDKPQIGWTLFGTDFLGQSTFRKMMYGVKTSMTVALCASIISLLIGVPMGAIAGYYRSWIDDIVVWLFTTFGTIPYILLVMAFAVVLRERTIFGLQIKGITAIYLAIGLTSWVGICR